MLIIKNGWVLDPLNRVDCVTDVAVEAGASSASALPIFQTPATL